ncbi:MAG: TIGR03013 family PEP-CTERM/XrtA system glycosyltransferase [Gammaproteobacteria bacterium]|nr:MAG: TIGR03013 family PEP-CTERM/XrtA system glycosyltransferase [Gammaproteobacteria bacterium]
MAFEQVQAKEGLKSEGSLRSGFTSTIFKTRYIRFYRSYLPVWMLFLCLTEVIVVGVALCTAFAIFSEFGVAGWMLTGEFIEKKVLFFTLVMFVIMVAMGLYQRRLREGSAGIALRVMVSHILAFLLLYIIYSIFPQIAIREDVILVSMVFSSTGVLFARLVFLRFFGTEFFKRRVLVLGSGKRAAGITCLRRWIDQVGYRIIGFIHIDGDNDQIDEDRIVRLNGEKLTDYVSRKCIDEIVVAFDDRRRRISMDDLLDCKMQGIHVIDLLDFYERETFKLKLDIMDPSWLIFSDGFKKNITYKIAKRLFDITVSAIILLFALPFMLITAIAVLIESGLPIFYTQTRIGEAGKKFRVMKFRSMVVNAEKNGAQWASKNDSRVTRVGAFIRLTRLDELPQLINVLRGDMSFVGPRPERPEFVAQFEERIPYYAERHRVKPGITGWAQVCYPYGASEEDAMEKLQYDLYYAKNYSIFLDFMILLQTAEVIIWQKGAR